MRKLRIILVWRLLTARRSLYQVMVIMIQQTYSAAHRHRMAKVFRKADNLDMVLSVGYLGFGFCWNITER